jgi:hypothetical protein
LLICSLDQGIKAKIAWKWGGVKLSLISDEAILSRGRLPGTEKPERFTPDPTEKSLSEVRGHAVQK